MFNMKLVTDTCIYEYLCNNYDLESISDWLDTSIWNLNPYRIYAECWISKSIDDEYLLSEVVLLMRNSFHCQCIFVEEEEGFMLYFEED